MSPVPYYVMTNSGCAGNVWAGLADTYGVHRKLFIVSYVASSLLRYTPSASEVKL